MNDFKFELTEQGRKAFDRATHMLTQTRGSRYAPLDNAAEYDVLRWLRRHPGASPKAIADGEKLPVWKARNVCIDLRTKGMVKRLSRAHLGVA